jgi:prepilin-type N-terminal cleavage/methylation domain-containing protein
MKFFRLKYFHHRRAVPNNAGFTLIEVMVAVAIMGIISLGAAVSSGQLLNQTTRDRNYTLASRNASNAIYWISRDALMAQKVEGWQDFPADGSLSLSWTSWNNVSFTANYAVTDGILTRTYSEGANTATTQIAEHINTGESMTDCVSANGTLAVTVTASVGEGARIIDVKKTRVISRRPGL